MKHGGHTAAMRGLHVEDGGAIIINQDLLFWITVGAIIGGWIGGIIGITKYQLTYAIIGGILGALAGGVIAWQLYTHPEWLEAIGL